MGKNYVGGICWISLVVFFFWFYEVVFIESSWIIVFKWENIGRVLAKVVCFCNFDRGGGFVFIFIVVVFLCCK